MRYETHLTFSTSLLRQAVLAYWKRSIGVGFLIAVGVVTADLILRLLDDDRSWIVGVLAAVVVMAVAFVVALYLVHYRAGLRKLRDMGSPHARLVAEEATFTVESGIGVSTFGWSAIGEVWRFPSFWLLFFSKAQFFTLPLDCVPADMQRYVLERVRAAGGKIA